MIEDLFRRIDSILAECDARQLPPLTAAVDPAGAPEHLVVVETDTGRLIHPEPALVVDVEPAATEPTTRVSWIRRMVSRRGGRQ